MYQFHYDYVKVKYPGDNSKLLFTDTDSLVYKIRSQNLYQDMLEDKDLFDFSGYSKDHACFSNKNKKVIGKMKDELNGLIIKEFIGLCAKMYSLKYDENETMTKAKGEKKYVIKGKISHEDYKECLFQNQEYLHTMNLVGSEFQHI